MTLMSSTRAAVVTLAAAMVTLTVAACTTVVDGVGTPPTAIATGSDSSSSESTDSTSEAPGTTSDSAPTTSDPATTSAPDPGTGGTGAITDVPADFPFPPGADVSKAGASALMTLTDPQGAYDFYISALPAAGYTITDKTSGGQGEGFYGSIDFNGKGVTTGQLAILGTTGALSLE